MIDNPTLGILSACVGTWINALLIDTSFVRRALGAGDTFRTAGWWASYVSRQTGTNSNTVYLPTLTVGPAWRSTARICLFLFHWIKNIYIKLCPCSFSSMVSLFLTRFPLVAVAVRITRIWRETVASCEMIDDLAFRICAANSWAGIDALEIDAATIGRAIRVDGTFGSTTLPGIAKITGNTGARAGVVAFGANCVCAARAWQTGRNWCRRWIRDCVNQIRE